jgi:hypothetical protein
MSAKSEFKGKKIALPKEPRALEVLQSEAQRALTELGQVTYQKFLYTRREQELNEQLLTVNQEGAARKELDEKASTEKLKKEESNEIA